jgi:D-alanyl-D-alanine carboxypeptidase
MHRVSLSLVLLAYLAVVQSVLPQGSPVPDADVAGKINSYFNSLVAQKKLSGVALVAKDGVTIASKTAGIANKTSGAPINLSTKFNLGSMNKMFTGVAIAQLAQAKRLSFTDTISKYLPDYPNKDVAGKVTIHQLLTHSSGLGMYWNDKFRAQREKLLTVSAHLPLFADDPLLFPPGEKFQYSNSGYMVLGAIIEKVSGQDYYSYVQDHIYKPAGMIDTGFYDPGKEIPNLAIGYVSMGPDGKELDEPQDNNGFREIRGGPAGGGYSTAEDLVRFHMALRSNKLLNPEYTELVMTGKMKTPRAGEYGYGFGVETIDGKRTVGHNGGAPGIAADFAMYPDSGFTTVLLMNCDPPAMMPIAKELRALVPGKP